MLVSKTWVYFHRTGSLGVFRLCFHGIEDSEDFPGAIVSHGASEHGFFGFVDFVKVQSDSEKSKAVIGMTSQHHQKPLNHVLERKPPTKKVKF